jgi:hypothetical protein
MNSNWFPVFLAVAISCTADPSPTQVQTKPPVPVEDSFVDKWVESGKTLEKTGIDFKSTGKLSFALNEYKLKYGTLEHEKLEVQLKQANGWGKAKILKKNRRFVQIAKEINLDLDKIDYIGNR